MDELKVLAAFPRRIVEHYGTHRWSAFQRQVADAFSLLSGTTVFWDDGLDEVRVIAPGMSWEEETAETRRVLRKLGAT